MSALEPDSIHVDITPQSTSYETGSIHYDRICTTNPTHSCNRNCAQLFAHVIGHAFVNRSAERLPWLLFYLLLRLRETKQTTLFGDETLDRKGTG